MSTSASALYSARNISRFAQLLPWILKWEGSIFTDDPLDAGGPTRYGVTQARYNQYRRDTKKPVQSVRFIEMPEVDSVYARYYWNEIKADVLPAPYDLALFNVAVNSGPGRAAQFRREVEAAHPGADALTLARAVCDRYERFYRGIVSKKPSQGKYLRGWLNRLNDCRLEIEQTDHLPGDNLILWTVFVGGTEAASAWPNPADGHRAYVPLRKMLRRFFDEKTVTTNLRMLDGEAMWGGKKMPVDELQRGVEAWVPVRQLAAWLGLDVEADGKERRITLTRPAGAAKAEGDEESEWAGAQSS